MAFDGLDDCLLDEDAEDYLNGLAAFTFAAWIKSNRTDTDAGFFNWRDPDGQDEYGFRYDRQLGQQWDLPNGIKGGLATSGGTQQWESRPNVQTTDWQHVVITWQSGEDIRVYLNGVLHEPGWIGAAVEGEIDSAEKLILGKAAKDLVSGWYGLLDDVRIYGRRLNAWEIPALADLAGPPSIESIAPADANEVTVVFGEPVDAASARTAAHYRIEGGPAVQSAALAGDGRTIRLALAQPMSDGAVYTLAVRGVADLAGNEIARGSQASFRYVAWYGADVGQVGAAGREDLYQGAWTIEGSGEDIWFGIDEFRYVYRPLTGSGEIVARVASVQNTNDWAKAGVMIRERLDDDSAHAMTVVTPTQGVCFQRRRVAGGESYHTGGNWSGSPYWVRLVREGDTFTSYMSADGHDWELVGSDTTELAQTVYVGLVVTSHNDGTLCTAVIDSVRVTEYSSPAPPPAATGPTATRSGLLGDLDATLGVTITAYDRIDKLGRASGRTDRLSFDFTTRAVAVYGTKFDDLNGIDGDGDGNPHDPGEPGLECVTLFNDGNENGLLDDGEPYTYTDANGDYCFRNVVLQTVHDPAVVVGTTPAPADGKVLAPSVDLVVTVNGVQADVVIPALPAQPAVAVAQNPPALGEVCFGPMLDIEVFDPYGAGFDTIGDPEPKVFSSLEEILSYLNWAIASSQELAERVFATAVPTEQGEKIAFQTSQGGGDLQVSVFPVQGAETIGFTEGVIGLGFPGGNATMDNETIDDLVEDLNAAIADSPHASAVAAGREGDYITFATIAAGYTASLEVADAAGAAGQIGFNTSQSATGSTRIPIAEVVPENATPTTPQAQSIQVTGGAQVATGVDFGDQLQRGAIQGTKWEDLDRDGQQDAGEGGLAGWTVFVDLDRDGKLDAFEPSTVTAADDPATPGVDETGTYQFAGLAPGEYVLAEVRQTGWAQSQVPEVVTVGAGQTVSGMDFGNYQSPEFTSAPVTAAVEDAGTPYSYSITTSHPSGTATISAVTLPESGWLTLTDHGDGTATLSGTPHNEDVGANAVVLQAACGGVTETQSFTIVVANTNDAPWFKSTAATGAPEDQPYVYDVEADDDDLHAAGVTETLTLRVVGDLPAWLRFEDLGGGKARLWGTPDNDTPDAHPVVLEVRDSSRAKAVQSFIITVTDRNDAPTVTRQIPDQEADEDEEFQFTFAADTFHDVDGDTLTYTATLPNGESLDTTWLRFDGGSRKFTGTPANGDVGTISVKVTADDGHGGTVSDMLEIVVRNVNDAPAKAVDDPVPDQAVKQGEKLDLAFAQDAFGDDDGDALVYAAALVGGAPLPTWLTFDPTQRRFTGTPANEDVGEIHVEVTADDGHGGLANDTFVITVANENDHPTVANPIPDQQAMEDEGFEFAFSADAFDDADGDALTYTATLADGSPLSGSWVSFDAAARRFSGTPANDDVGEIGIKVTADDAHGGTVTGTFLIIVANVNDAPAVAHEIPDRNATEDALFELTFAEDAFDDVDGDALAYAAARADGSPLPAWLVFEAAGRRFRGTPANDDVGEVWIQVTADDGHGGRASDTFLITVANTNDAPTVAHPIPDVGAVEDASFTFTFAEDTFADVDAADALAYEAALACGLPLPGWLGFSAAARTFHGTPRNGDVGVICVEVTATDGSGASVSDSFRITVANANDEPRFVSSPVTAALEDGPYVYEVIADDDDLRAAGAAEHLTLSAVDLPDWLELTDHADGTATLAGTPRNEHVGGNPVTLRVTDAAGAAAEQAFLIVVANANDEPFFTSAPPTAATEDSPYAYEVAAGDVDAGDVLRFDAPGLPLWLELADHGDGTATLAGTPVNRDVGANEVTLRVIDAAGAVVAQSFTILVENTNDEPVAADDAYSTPEDAVLSVLAPGVLGNDTDVDAGDEPAVLAYDAASARGAAVTVHADGSFTYDPTGLFEWLGWGTWYTDTFGYTIDDGHGATDSATVTITVTGVGSLGLITWHSYDVVTSAGPPQGVVVDQEYGLAAELEFYESADDGGVALGTVLSNYSPGPHPENGNECHVENFWSMGTGYMLYPYVGKSTVGRGADEGESNAPYPIGVRDLQLHPPNSDHLIVAAFVAPINGWYTLRDLAARRIDERRPTSREVIYRVFGPSGTEIVAMTATSDRAWVTDSNTYDLGQLQAGDRVYFAVDRAEAYYWDSTEIAWTVTAAASPDPLRILSWHSAAAHGPAVEEALLEIPDDGTFCEPRASGLSRLVITFSQPIDPASLTPSSVQVCGLNADNEPIDLSRVAVTTDVRSGNTVGVAAFDEKLPDGGRYLVRLAGVTDAAGNGLAGDNDRIVTALLGDVNGDREVDQADEDAASLLAGTEPIHAGSTEQVRADVNPDGRIDGLDVGMIESNLLHDARSIADPKPFVPGDADHDGEVGCLDYLAVKMHVGKKPAIWTDGDFDADADVDRFDFQILKRNFGQSIDLGGPEMLAEAPAGAPAEAPATAEPTGLAAVESDNEPPTAATARAAEAAPAGRPARTSAEHQPVFDVLRVRQVPLARLQPRRRGIGAEVGTAPVGPMQDMEPRRHADETTRPEQRSLEPSPGLGSPLRDLLDLRRMPDRLRVL
jgi:hypothetical protein